MHKTDLCSSLFTTLEVDVAVIVMSRIIVIVKIFGDSDDDIVSLFYYPGDRRI